DTIPLLDTDDELSYRMHKHGMKLYLSPRIKSEYAVRSSYKKFAHMFDGKALLREITDHDERAAFVEAWTRVRDVPAGSGPRTIVGYGVTASW
ncbi:MAG: hypothetical protein EBS89_06195, partial [Proteobacteria bacterium]|nr:hypothetical protein [Pseudomonadota bacterium]